MIKIIPAAWDFDDPITSVVQIHSRGVDRAWLTKRAACFTDDEIRDLRPDPGTSILHINAVGDFEAYSCNRNGDGFLEKGGQFVLEAPKEGVANPTYVQVGNVQTHPTFVKLARVYRNHKNDDPRHSYGPVYKSAHNDRMKRIELLIGVPNDAFADELQKLAKGEQVGWSMSTRVPFDICSICGNRAKTARHYCEHIQKHRTQVTKKGNVVAMINDHMNYFDISRVRRAADRIALTLRKVASLEAATESGAELAELLGLRTPRHVLEASNPRITRYLECVQKLAEIEKEVPAEVDTTQREAYGRGRLREEDVETMRQSPTDDVLCELDRRHVVLSLKDLLRLVSRQPLGKPQDMEGADTLVPGVFGRALQDDRIEDILPGEDSPQSDGSLLPAIVKHMLDRVQQEHSLDDGPARKRVTIIVIRRGSQPGKVKTAAEKPFVSSTVSSRMADEYARYQLRFLDRTGADEELMRRMILGNYLAR